MTNGSEVFRGRPRRLMQKIEVFPEPPLMYTTALCPSRGLSLIADETLGRLAAIRNSSPLAYIVRELHQHAE